MAEAPGAEADRDLDDLDEQPAGTDVGLAAALDDLRCHPAFLDLLRPFEQHRPAVVAVASTSKTGGYLLSGAPGCQAAVYLGPRRLFVALLPSDARAVAERTRAKICEKDNNVTLHLRVLAYDLVDGGEKNRIRAAITTALDLSAERPRRHSKQRPRSSG